MDYFDNKHPDPQADRQAPPPPVDLRLPSGFEPNDGQSNAFAVIFDRLQDPSPDTQVTTVAGPGGTGKTCLAPLVAMNLRDPNRIRVQTPFGRAAVRVAEVFRKYGMPLPAFRVGTIHAALYGRVTKDASAGQGHLRFSNPHAPAGPNDIVIIDELSTFSRKVWEDYRKHLPPTTKVLGLGDYCQLEPVNDTWAFDLRRPTVELTEIMRQALASGIIRAANVVRIGSGVSNLQWTNIAEVAEVMYSSDKNWNSFDDLSDPADGSDSDCLFLDGCNLARAADFVTTARSVGDDTIFITFTNDSVNRANDHVARRLREAGVIDRQTQADPACRKLHMAASIAIGDRIIGRRNNYDLGWMNGEILTVLDVEVVVLPNRMQAIGLDLWGDERRALLLPAGPIFNEDGLKANEIIHPKRRPGKPAPAGDNPFVDWSFVLCSRGEAVTIHRFQGSEADYAMLYIDGATNRMRTNDRDGWRRLVYTGMSRACRRLVVAGDLR